MKTSFEPVAAYAEPTEDENRDYAYHLYEQSGRIPGRDLENWFEASACLRANLPRQQDPQGPSTAELFGPDIEAEGVPVRLSAKKHVM